MDRSIVSHVFSYIRKKNRPDTELQDTHRSADSTEFTNFKPANSSRVLLNLKGEVRNMASRTRCGNAPTSELSEYEFDEQGLIKRIGREGIWSDFSYDDRNRIICIKSEEVKTTFIYGSHDKYIDVDWCDELPRFMQGIEMLVDKNGEDATILTWIVEGQTARCIETNNGEICEIGKMTFEGPFIKTTSSTDGVTKSYTFNPATGALLCWEERSDDQTTYQLHSDDLCNNIRELVSESPGTKKLNYTRRYTENEQGDLTSSTDNGDSIRYEYEYDNRGNWTKRIGTDGSGQVRETTERTFTYR